MPANPQTKANGRRFHCRKCNKTTATLGELRSHHSKAHWDGTIPVRKPKPTTLVTLPTLKLRVKRVAGKGPGSKLAHNPSISFCPACGERLAAWRKLVPLSKE